MRNLAISAIPALAGQHCAVVHAIIKSALEVWLSAQDSNYDPHKIIDPESGESSASRSQKIGQLLNSLFTSSQAQASMQDLAVGMLIIAHHPALTENVQTSWINLVQGAGLDPADLAVERREQIVASLWAATEISTSVRIEIPIKSYD